MLYDLHAVSLYPSVMSNVDYVWPDIEHAYVYEDKKLPNFLIRM